MERERWLKLSGEEQFAYADLLELTIQDYMRQVGDPQCSICGFPSLGSPYVITVITEPPARNESELTNDHLQA